MFSSRVAPIISRCASWHFFLISFGYNTMFTNSLATCLFFETLIKHNMDNIITEKQVRSWAKQIANELTFAYALGQPKTFTHYYSDNDSNLCFEAEVEYACEVWEDEGINDTPPSWWTENERVIVHQVIDQYDRQRPAIAERLEWWLN